MRFCKYIKEIFVIIIAFCILSISLISTDIVNAASKYYGNSGPSNISSLTVPTVLKKGDCCSIGGKVSINNPYGYSWKCGIAVYKAEYLENGYSMQSRISSSIKSASAASAYYTKNTSSYDLGNLDYAIQFNSLEVGKYAYTIYVCKKTSNSVIYEDYYTCEFVVDSRYTLIPTPVSGNTALTDFTKPDKISKGRYFILKGNVLELYDLFNNGSVSHTSYPHSMYAYVTNSSGGYIQGSGNGKFSTSTSWSAFDKNRRRQPIPKNIDNEIQFNTYDKGEYVLYYCIYNYKNERYSDGAENYSRQLAKFKFSII